MATTGQTAAATTDQAPVEPSSRPGAEGDAPRGRDVSLGVAATVAGLGLLVMAVLAFLGTAGLNSMTVDGEAGRTAQGIAGHELVLRLAVGGFLAVAVLDVVVAWALYLLLRPANPGIALLAAWLRVAYAAVFAAAVTNLLAAARLATDGHVRDALGRPQADAQSFASMAAFTGGWNLALAVFGVHLLVLGVLVARAVYMPRLVGVLVMIAGVGYLVDGLASTLSARYHIKLSAFAFIGEVVLMAWLLWRGRRLQHSATRDELSSAAASA